MIAFRASTEAMRTFIHDKAPTGLEKTITVTEDELLSLDAAIAEEQETPRLPEWSKRL